jgi:hypothetical protein
MKIQMPFFRLLIGKIPAKISRVSTVQEISQAIEPGEDFR